MRVGLLGTTFVGSYVASRTLLDKVGITSITQKLKEVLGVVKIPFVSGAAIEQVELADRLIDSPIDLGIIGSLVPQKYREGEAKEGRHYYPAIGIGYVAPENGPVPSDILDRPYEDALKWVTDHNGQSEQISGRYVAAAEHASDPRIKDWLAKTRDDLIQIRGRENIYSIMEWVTPSEGTYIVPGNTVQASFVKDVIALQHASIVTLAAYALTDPRMVHEYADLIQGGAAGLQGIAKEVNAAGQTVAAMTDAAVPDSVSLL